MARMYAIAGERIFIGTDPMSDQDDDFVASDFSSVAWIEVTGWTQRGEFGDSRTSVTSEQIGRPRVKKASGTFDAGTMENTFDRNNEDPGQKKLKEAMKSGDNYPIRVVDPLRAGQSTSAEAMFIGLPQSSRRNGGGPNDPDRLAAAININSNIVEVAAT